MEESTRPHGWVVDRSGKDLHGLFFWPRHVASSPGIHYEDKSGFGRFMIGRTIGGHPVQRVHAGTISSSTRIDQ